MKAIRNSLPLIGLITALLALRWTVVEPYVVPTGSMEPTLKPGDRLYALKCAYDIRLPFTDVILFRTGKVERGDVILFKAPRDPSITYVKRALGLPGDLLEFRQGELYINDAKIPRELAPDDTIMQDLSRPDERILYVENLTGLRHYMVLDQFFGRLRTSLPIRIPEGHLFAVGDNRDNSHDSRAWGFVPMENLKGKAMFIWYSSKHFNGAPWWENLKLALTAPRSERVGTLIQ